MVFRFLSSLCHRRYFWYLVKMDEIKLAKNAPNALLGYTSMWECLRTRMREVLRASRNCNPSTIHSERFNITLIMHVK